MAVKVEKNDENLTLVLDNGDFEKFQQVMKKWDFKDEQSMIRFCISILLLSEDKSISITMDGKNSFIKPNASLLKDKGE